MRSCNARGAPQGCLAMLFGGAAWKPPTARAQSAVFPRRDIASPTAHYAQRQVAQEPARQGPQDLVKPVAPLRLPPTPGQASDHRLRPGAQFAAARRQPVPAFDAAPGDDLETRLRELEQQFEEQRFQYESLRQQMEDAQQAATAPSGPPSRYRVGSNLNMTGVWTNG